MLAVIQEVLFALVDAIGRSREALEAVRLKKLADRGGFEQRIFLEEVK